MGAATRSTVSRRRRWTPTPRAPCTCRRRNANSRKRGSAATAARRTHASCCTSPTTRRCSHARGKTRARSTGTRSRKRWDATIGGELAAIAPAVSNARGPGAGAPGARRGPGPGGPQPGGPPSREAQQRALAKALVLVSDKHPAWTRHDLLKQLALVMPPETRHMDAARRAGTAARAGRRGPVAAGPGMWCALEAPQWPPLPASLRRELDGRSVYTRPGVARYATAAQLSMEDKLVAQAQAHAAPRLTREHSGAAARRRSRAAGGAAARARARRTRAAPRTAGCGWTRPPPSGTCSPHPAPPR